MDKEKIIEKIDRLRLIMDEAKEIIVEVEPYINEVCGFDVTKNFENVPVNTVNFGKANIRIQNTLGRGNVQTMGELFRLGSFGFLRIRSAGKLMAEVIRTTFKEQYDVEWV